MKGIQTRLEKIDFATKIMLFLFQETFILSVFDQTLFQIPVKEKIRIFAASYEVKAKAGWKKLRCSDPY